MAKMIAFGDTHMQFFPDLPRRQDPRYRIAGFEQLAAKYLGFSGDYESKDNEPEDAIQIGKDFLNWLSQWNAEYKVMVPGNHDSWFWNDPDGFKSYAKSKDIIVLDRQLIKLGKLRFWGSPYLYTHRRNNHFDAALPTPGSFDVMITHVPPFGVMDFSASKKENIGSPTLRNYVQNNNVRLHIFGHCHEGNGQAGPFHNVAMASRGKKKNLIYPPRLIDVNYLTQ